LLCVCVCAYNFFLPRVRAPSTYYTLSRISFSWLLLCEEDDDEYLMIEGARAKGLLMYAWCEHKMCQIEAPNMESCKSTLFSSWDISSEQISIQFHCKLSSLYLEPIKRNSDFLALSHQELQTIDSNIFRKIIKKSFPLQL
jgi:hypothetical protein